MTLSKRLAHLYRVRRHVDNSLAGRRHARVQFEGQEAWVVRGGISVWPLRRTGASSEWLPQILGISFETREWASIRATRRRSPLAYHAAGGARL